MKNLLKRSLTSIGTSSDSFNQKPKKEIFEPVKSEFDRKRSLIRSLSTLSAAALTSIIAKKEVNAVNLLEFKQQQENLLQGPNKSNNNNNNPKEVIKSPNDNRNYYAFTIPENQLRVLLIHDPLIQRAGAAMDVHVGSFSDPKSVPGIAHFCEHMLFLGTKKYPEEDSFSTYLANHGGSSNAYTDAEDTVYVSNSIKYL
jgi:Zn-dependent M16 (insulinase) family peptidase